MDSITPITITPMEKFLFIGVAIFGRQARTMAPIDRIMINHPCPACIPLTLKLPIAPALNEPHGKKVEITARAAATMIKIRCLCIKRLLFL